MLPFATSTSDKLFSCVKIDDWKTLNFQNDFCDLQLQCTLQVVCMNFIESFSLSTTAIFLNLYFWCWNSRVLYLIIMGRKSVCLCLSVCQSPLAPSLLHDRGPRPWHLSPWALNMCPQLPLRKLVERHSRARGNILVGPKTFSRGPSGKKFFEFFFSKWYILAYFIFLADGGAPKRRRGQGS